MRAESERQGRVVGIKYAHVAVQSGVAQFVANFQQKIGRPERAPIGRVDAQLELPDDGVFDDLNDPPRAIDHQAVDGVPLAVLVDAVEYIFAAGPSVPSAADAVGKGKQERNAAMAGAVAGGRKIGRGIEHVDDALPDRKLQLI